MDYITSPVQTSGRIMPPPSPDLVNAVVHLALLHPVHAVAHLARLPSVVHAVAHLTRLPGERSVPLAALPGSQRFTTILSCFLATQAPFRGEGIITVISA